MPKQGLRLHSFSCTMCPVATVSPTVVRCDYIRIANHSKSGIALQADDSHKASLFGCLSRPRRKKRPARRKNNVLHEEEKEEFALIKGPMLAASLQILCFTLFHLAFRQKQTLLGPGGHGLLALCLHPPSKALGSSILIA